MSKIFTLIIMLLAGPLAAQFSYELDQSIPVSVNGQQLSMPWAGGLNSPQFSTIDLNADGVEDLVTFDRAANKLSTFLSENNAYVYAPNYELLFPKGLNNWVLLRDFNCDGKKDIITSDPRGAVVYINTTRQGEPLSWRIFNYRPENNQSFLLTQGFSSVINLQINGLDLPAVDDVDNDGDLDILAFRSFGASTVEFHKNLSMERDGNCDSLQFERVTQTWGDFEECRCGVFALEGSDCPPANGGKTQHQGGKTLLTMDVDGDQVKDLLVSEENCTELFLLKNTGTNENPLITSVDSQFPNSTNPARLFIFPAAYYEDVNFDGVKDLLVAPNVPANVGSSVNFESSSWRYDNSATNQNPSFTLVQRDFLQNEMIDLGENAAPAFADIDGDGDQDMLVSSFINFEQFGFRSTIRHFENTGTIAEPSFELLTDDFETIFSYNLINIKPKFRDIDGDGNLDLVIQATELNNGSTNIYYLRNTSSSGVELEQQLNLYFNVSNTFPSNDNYELADINNDGALDLLIGRSTGKLEYYQNQGTTAQPMFELEDDTFYGLDFSPFRQHPAAAVADYDGDGNQDLLVGDRGGNLVLYPEFLNYLDDPQPGITKLFRVEGSADSLNQRIGNKLFATPVNLFNAEKTAIVIGTGAGGLRILKHTETESNPVPVFPDLLAVYPNPVRQGQPLKIVVKETFSLAVISLQGQTIFSNVVLQPGNTLNLPTEDLQPGMYILVGRKGEFFEAKRFVVVR